METNQILLERFINNHPQAAARTIEKLNDDEIVAFITNTPEELTMNIISTMHSYRGAKCLELSDPQLAVKLLERIDINKAELLMRQSSEAFRSNMLKALSAKKSTVLKQKLSHPANSIGASMIPSFLSLRKETTVKEAIAFGKKEKERLSSQIYIVNEDGKLEGIVKMNNLLTEEKTTRLSSIMITEIPKFFADTKIETVTEHPGWYEFQEIAVVDSSDRLIGTLPAKASRKNKKKTGQEVTKDIVLTSNALGELYRIGMTGFLQSISK